MLVLFQILPMMDIKWESAKKGEKLTKACYESTVIWLVWEGLEMQGLHNMGGNCVHRMGLETRGKSQREEVLAI